MIDYTLYVTLVEQTFTIETEVYTNIENTRFSLCPVSSGGTGKISEAFDICTIFLQTGLGTTCPLDDDYICISINDETGSNLLITSLESQGDTASMSKLISDVIRYTGKFYLLFGTHDGSEYCSDVISANSGLQQNRLFLQIDEDCNNYSRSKSPLSSLPRSEKTESLDIKTYYITHYYE